MRVLKFQILKHDALNFGLLFQTSYYQTLINVNRELRRQKTAQIKNAEDILDRRAVGTKIRDSWGDKKRPNSPISMKLGLKKSIVGHTPSRVKTPLFGTNFSGE